MQTFDDFYWGVLGSSVVFGFTVDGKANVELLTKHGEEGWLVRAFLINGSGPTVLVFAEDNGVVEAIQRVLGAVLPIPS
jgi:hypothetical protein